MLQSVASAKGALHENLTKMQGTVSGSVQTYSVQFQKETETMQTSASEGMFGVWNGCCIYSSLISFRPTIEGEARTTGNHKVAGRGGAERV